MKVGVVQFGQGEIEDDGSVSKAKIVQPLTFNMKKVGKAVKKLKWEMGFTNMAQAFTMSENLFRDGGRAKSKSQIIVITDGKPSFKFMTQKAVDDLRDAGVHVNIVAVHDHKGSKDVKLMSHWASVPFESHMIHIPGLKRLQQATRDYVTKTMVQFCPRAQSPKLMKKKVKKFGYKMIYENRDCRNWWGRLHKHCTGRRCNTARDCAVAARKAGKKYFLFGKRRWGRGRPRCYANKKNNSKCTFKKRPWMRRKGWIKSKVDVFKVTFSTGKKGKKKFLLSEEEAKDAASAENLSKDSDIVMAEDNNSEEDGDREKMTDEEIAAEEKEMDEEEGEDVVDPELVDVNADVADLGEDAESDAIDEEMDDDDNEAENQDELAAENDDLPIEEEGGIESESEASETEEPEEMSE